MPLPQPAYYIRLEHLPHGVTLSWVMDQGSVFGEVVYCQLIRSRVQREALLGYRTSQEAALAIQSLDRKELSGNTLICWVCGDEWVLRWYERNEADHPKDVFIPLSNPLHPTPPEDTAEEVVPLPRPITHLLPSCLELFKPTAIPAPPLPVPAKPASEESKGMAKTGRGAKTASALLQLIRGKRESSGKAERDRRPSGYRCMQCSARMTSGRDVCEKCKGDDRERDVALPPQKKARMSVPTALTQESVLLGLAIRIPTHARCNVSDPFLRGYWDGTTDPPSAKFGGLVEFIRRYPRIFLLEHEHGDSMVSVRGVTREPDEYIQTLSFLASAPDVWSLESRVPQLFHYIRNELQHSGPE
eukprot:Sspe_Gene.10762::Locus_3615_Transcript_2_3_Confidence_0.500_Length_1185::g.10762::m.10762